MYKGRTFAQMKRSVPISSLIEEVEERLGHRGWGQCAVAERCFVRTRRLETDYVAIINRLLKRGYSPETVSKLIELGKEIAFNASQMKRNLREIEYLSLQNIRPREKKET